MYYHFDGNIVHKGGGGTIPPTLHYDSKMATHRFRQRGRLGLAVKRALASKDVKYICRSSILKGRFKQLHVYMKKHDIISFNVKRKAHNTVPLKIDLYVTYI